MLNKTVVSIGAVTAIIICCVFKGIDGYLVFTGVSLIAGLGGFALGKVTKH